MKRTVLSFGLAAAAWCAFPQEAFAWSEATHAYIADHIGKRSSLKNYNEMYGAMVPDLFNTKQFEYYDQPELYQCVRTHTHGFIPLEAEDFMNVWDQAGWGLDRNVAFGYVSHNDVWGADVAAHWYGYTNEDPEMGWVMEKAYLLIEELDSQGVWDALGIPLVPSDNPWVFQPAELLSQYLVMKAGDAVIRREDPQIGAKVALSALLRTPRFSSRLADAMPCAEKDVVIAAEEDFQKQTAALGLVLLLGEEQYLTAVSLQLVELGPAFLSAYGVPLTPEKEPYFEVVVTWGLQRALELIQDDYMVEIGAIVANIESEMAENGVSY